MPMIGAERNLMRTNRLLAVPQYPVPVDAALLLVRLVVGIAFTLHGWGKIQHPTSWMGPDGSAPPVFQALAAVSEFGGGIALVLGLLARLGALGILCTMAVAFWTHAVMRGDPFVS